MANYQTKRRTSQPIESNKIFYPTPLTNLKRTFGNALTVAC